MEKLVSLPDNAVMVGFSVVRGDLVESQWFGATGQGHLAGATVAARAPGNAPGWVPRCPSACPLPGLTTADRFRRQHSNKVVTFVPRIVVGPWVPPRPAHVVRVTRSYATFFPSRLTKPKNRSAGRRRVSAPARGARVGSRLARPGGGAEGSAPVRGMVAFRG